MCSFQSSILILLQMYDTNTYVTIFLTYFYILGYLAGGHNFVLTSGFKKHN